MSTLAQQNSEINKNLAALTLAINNSRTPTTPVAPSPSNDDDLSYSGAGSDLLNATKISSLPVPPVINGPDNQQINANDDGISIQSQQLAALISSTINFEKYDAKWEDDPTKSQLWYENVIACLAAKNFYHSLLTPDHLQINFDVPTTNNANSNIASVLTSKLPTTVLTLFKNSNVRSGVEMMGYIYRRFSEAKDSEKDQQDKE